MLLLGVRVRDAQTCGKVIMSFTVHDQGQAVVIAVDVWPGGLELDWVLAINFYLKVT